MMIVAFLAALAAQTAAAPATAWPTQEHDVVLKAFRFRSGELMPQLRLHYTTLGQPHRSGRLLPEAGAAVTIGFSVDDTIIVPKDAEAAKP